jgi:hypothetical protein
MLTSIDKIKEKLSKWADNSVLSIPPNTQSLIKKLALKIYRGDREALRELSDFLDNGVEFGLKEELAIIDKQMRLIALEDQLRITQGIMTKDQVSAEYQKFFNVLSMVVADETVDRKDIVLVANERFNADE